MLFKAKSRLRLMDLIHLMTILILVTFFQQGIHGNGIETPHKRLLQDLLDAYGAPSLRPVRNLTTSVQIQLRLLIAQVIKFDERAQQLKISAWMKQTWTDEFLRWNQSEYDGVDSLTVSLSQIWIPDITLYENVNGAFEQYKPIDAIVLPDGNVTWYAPVILTTSCKVKVRYFPFDSQSCQLRFASWKHDMSQLDILYSDDADAMQSVFHGNGVWDLVDVQSVRTEVDFACCHHPIAFVTFHLFLKRESGFYIFNIVIPCILLALLTLMVFCLPHDSGEKISFGTTNLLALILYQQLIADSMPPLGDEFALVGVYFSSLVVIGCCSITGTVCVLRLWHTKTINHPFPPYLRRLLTSPVTKYLMNFQDIIYKDVATNRDAQERIFSISGKVHTPDKSKDIEDSTPRRHIGNNVKLKDDDSKDILSDWQKVAMVVDRLLFVTLCTITLVILTFIFLLFLFQSA
ncbi:neuronal acetylcholine receptor subunit alpha-10-like [Amphiura filiformis]|uniref:neuronal acetylcholine receptor subunit alpha-10-like n=1 Tax=Amphiura filiformis TaxID=82378 RepID=UPI003B220206